MVTAVVVFVIAMALNNLTSETDTARIPVKITITEGMTANQIGQILHDRKVIDNVLVFKLAVKKEGVEAEFKPGVYDLETGMDYDEVIDELIKGPPIKIVKLTFPEGWTAKQIAERVSARTQISMDEYLNMITTGSIRNDYPFLANNGAPTANLEGYLYPQTYNAEEDISAEEFIAIQLDEFQKRTGSFNWNNSSALGRTPYEIVVVASLIERETRVDTEKPLVASVIYNRLKKNMMLQIDATVQYALPQQKERLLNDDLKIDSPYNTYKHPGLPPGPICNPAAASINAALNPTATEYLYYVLAPDNSGRHVFANTYNEFLNAKNVYLRSR